VENLSFNVSAVSAGAAYLHALIMSGFTNQTNYFYGFLKHRGLAQKKVELETIFAQLDSTALIFYEAVHRIKETINLLALLLPTTTKMTLSRELTKINEEIIYGTVQEINDFVHRDQFIEKGEFVIVVDYQKEAVTFDDQQLLERLKQAIKEGLKIKEAAKEVSQATKVNKNYLYDLYLKNK
jgi:16S rRNA (cytidine1402-2'-O)-methyltransferase